ncbi:MAG TPA: hypothetical protein VEZ11_00220 [Thermoanaerobaculia bacterium]|nr:hypothetical protein [Thermoanaerobaculia bacterium]
MNRYSTLLLAAIVAAVPMLATAADPPPIPDAFKNQTNFCSGTYALCIKAACVPVPTLDRLGNYYVEHALCTCDVVQGWSMGPGSCEDRQPVTNKNGKTYLISTYSNLYNSTHLTLSCPNTEAVWAWCFGAPCAVDEKDPTKAVCNCPVTIGAFMTLGGECRPSACKGLWSAATPQGDKFANDYYAWYMKENKLPPSPPAQACPVDTPVPSPKGRE